MRKLKLQMMLSLDGFVARPNGALDWMTWDRDDALLDYINDLIDTSGTILMGRKMTPGFIDYWTSIKTDDPQYEFSRKMVDTPKVVFTKTLDHHDWVNTTLAKGDLSDEINQLKNQEGKDIIAYGGASFVSSLIKNNLIDDYHLFINPTAIGKGLEIFSKINNTHSLKLIKSTPFSVGIVINHYQPVK